MLIISRFRGIHMPVWASFGQIQKPTQSNLIRLVRFGFHNFFKPNPFMNGLVQFGPTGYPFKFDLFFLRITILYHDSSKYLMQLT